MYCSNWELCIYQNLKLSQFETTGTLDADDNLSWINVCKNTYQTNLCISSIVKVHRFKHGSTIQCIYILTSFIECLVTNNQTTWCYPKEITETSVSKLQKELGLLSFLIFTSYLSMYLSLVQGHELLSVVYYNYFQLNSEVNQICTRQDITSYSYIFERQTWRRAKQLELWVKDCGILPLYIEQL